MLRFQPRLWSVCFRFERRPFFFVTDFEGLTVVAGLC
jgi:hypothetical protein